MSQSQRQVVKKHVQFETCGATLIVLCWMVTWLACVCVLDRLGLQRLRHIKSAVGVGGRSTLLVAGWKVRQVGVDVQGLMCENAERDCCVSQWSLHGCIRLAISCLKIKLWKVCCGWNWKIGGKVDVLQCMIISILGKWKKGTHYMVQKAAWFYANRSLTSNPYRQK